MATRGQLIVLAGALVCIAGGGLVWSRHRASGKSVPAARAGLAGSSSCRGCHAKFYELWSNSHHGLAMQPITPEFARRNLNLNQQPVRVGQTTYAPEVDAKAAWVVERSSKGTRRCRLEQAMGGKYVYYFLTTLECGYLQVLPPAYDVRQKAWIDSTGSMVMHESGPSATPVDWRDRTLTFNTSCYRALVEIYEQQGHLKEAAAICLKAVGDPALPQQARLAFAARASRQASTQTNR